MKQGTNSADMRLKNEKTILSLIHTNAASRAEISRITGLTRAAVTIITDELLKKNLIIETIAQNPGIGRTPLLLSFNGSKIFAASINITREDITVGIVDFSGNILSEEQYDIMPPETFFKEISGMLEKQIKASGIDRNCIYNLGVAAPGPIDKATGTIMNPPNFKSWHNVPVCRELEKQFPYDINFANVSSAAALAEKYFGAAKNTQNFITLIVNEGIGSGIILKGKLFDGAAELGHISINFSGPMCSCGNRGCLESYASTKNILKAAGLRTWNEVIDSGNTQIIEREAEYLSTALISAINLFSLDTVIISGDICYKSEKLIGMIKNKLNSRLLNSGSLAVYCGEIHSKSQVSAALAVDGYFTP